MKTISGFHAIEELIKVGKKQNKDLSGAKILYSKTGPRVKSILKQAEELNIPTIKEENKTLDRYTEGLPKSLMEHRGIILLMPKSCLPDSLSEDELIAVLSEKKEACVVILDCITDPHNIGSIVRSADQFAVDAVVVCNKNSSGSFEVISKVSAGASAWVPIVSVVNLSRFAEKLKQTGFWIFAADAGGEPLCKTSFPAKTALVMGSEGQGIGALLQKKCDKIISIPTNGKLDSLNVSVAAGILLYEVYRQKKL